MDATSKDGAGGVPCATIAADTDAAIRTPSAVFMARILRLETDVRNLRKASTRRTSLPAMGRRADGAPRGRDPVDDRRNDDDAHGRSGRRKFDVQWRPPAVTFSGSISNGSDITDATQFTGTLTINWGIPSGPRLPPPAPCIATGQFTGTLNWTRLIATAPRMTLSRNGCGESNNVTLSLVRQQ